MRHTHEAYLQARVELKEVELGRLRKEEVLDGACVRVVDHQCEVGSRELHLAHRLRRDSDRRALLNDLLEAAAKHGPSIESGRVESSRVESGRVESSRVESPPGERRREKEREGERRRDKEREGEELTEFLAVFVDEDDG